MREELNEENIVNKIKEKKELSGLSRDLVLDVIVEYLEKHKINLGKLGKREVKLVVKEIRAQLRKNSGMFQKSLKKRIGALDDIDGLLETHRSTAERLEFYPKLREIIRELDVKSILDLGAGLNPVALAEKGIEYYAFDIREDDMEIVSEFFRKKGISGEAVVRDLRKVSSLPKADICLIFKVLDIIEDKGHRIAGELIDKIDSKYILISFAKKTLSGKPMRYPRRRWLESILHFGGYKFKIFNSENEVFYLAQRE